MFAKRDECIFEVSFFLYSLLSIQYLNIINETLQLTSNLYATGIRLPITKHYNQNKNTKTTHLKIIHNRQT